MESRDNIPSGSKPSGYGSTSIQDSNITDNNDNISSPSELEQGIRKSVIYCVHGNAKESCCNILDIKTATPIEETSHCHQANRAVGIDKIARKKLLIASILCVFFMIAEIIGGVLSNSLAIATDAAHLLADLASFMISLLALYIASRRSTKRMSFGWHRAEVLGALVSVFIIWIVTAVLVYLAVLRTISMDFEVEGGIMLITSFLGIIVNIIMGCTLHGHGHGHGHSHSSSNGHGHEHVDSTDSKSGKSNAAPRENMNVRAAIIHVVSDFLQSCGVFLAALVIYFKPEWKIVDPICTFLFSILVLITTLNIIKDALLVLMEATPKYLDYTEILETFLQIDGVVRVHNLRIWALSVNKIALAAHLAVEPNTNTESVLKEATKKIHAQYEFFETTLQIEEFQADMENCKQCTIPE